MPLNSFDYEEYYSAVRGDLIALIPKNGNNKILEVGSGGGNTLVDIKKNRLAREVVGIELRRLPHTMQDHPSIDKFVIGNIESLTIEFPNEYFDVIICGDVIEHLINPKMVINKLCKYLKKDGKFILSVPNIREIQTLAKIAVCGDFRYEPQGILDESHIRFFCKKNIVAMLISEGLLVDFIEPNFKNKRNKRNILNLHSRINVTRLVR